MAESKWKCPLCGTKNVEEFEITPETTGLVCASCLEEIETGDITHYCAKTEFDESRKHVDLK